MSWIQTAYLIAEVIAIPLTGLFTRVLTLRWLFVDGRQPVHACFDRLRASVAALPYCWLFRVLQGFSGGVLIPAVFSAVFLLFPPRLHAVATTIGGVVAVLAPTIGPVVGGWITDTWSWPWLFLINVMPGLVGGFADAISAAAAEADLGEFAKLDAAVARSAGGGACRASRSG